MGCGKAFRMTMLYPPRLVTINHHYRYFPLANAPRFRDMQLSKNFHSGGVIAHCLLHRVSIHNRTPGSCQTNDTQQVVQSIEITSGAWHDIRLWDWCDECQAWWRYVRQLRRRQWRLARRPHPRHPSQHPSSIILSTITGRASGTVPPSWEKEAARSQGPAPDTRPQNNPSKYYDSSSPVQPPRRVASAWSAGTRRTQS